jgi:hypothetical protein
MANEEQLRILLEGEGIEVWNEWRRVRPACWVVAARNMGGSQDPGAACHDNPNP